MRLGFLSDLHLAPGRSNRCTSSEDELIALLDWLDERCDQVILVGDVFDLLRPERWRAWPEHLDAIALEFPRLFRRLRFCRAVYGNHDAPRANMNVPEEIMIAHERGMVLVTHGHQADPWLKKVWGMEEAGNFVAGWFERAGLSFVASAMGHVPSLLERTRHGDRGRDHVHRDEGSKPGEQERSAVFARSLLGDRADVVVMGHSHGLGLSAIGEGLFINTGSHVHGWKDAVTLDLDAGVAATWRDGACVQIAEHAREGWSVLSCGDSARAREIARRIERGDDLTSMVRIEEE